jgi:propionate CoA-transferase
MSATSIVPTARSGETGKVVTAREAVRLIRGGDTIAIGGFGGIGLAEEVVHELGEIYKASDAELASFGKPSDLTLFFGVGQGHPFTGRGLNRLAEPGLIKRVIGGHFNFIPAIQRLVVGNQIEGYNLPLGPITHLYRDIAAGKPGHLSRIGLGTFVDPRFGGGKLNEKTTEDLVELMTVGGRESLLQSDPDQCRHHSRHDRRPGRQHHHGARGTHDRSAIACNGGAQLGRACDRAG